LNGCNLLTIIKQKSPETKALMLTNSTDEDAIIKALMAGAKGYLSKDASVSCLLNAIKVIDNGELWVERKLIAKYFNDAANSNSVQQEPRKKANQALTPREKEVLHLLTEGKTNKEIAQKLFISEKTVKSHLNRIFKKFNVTRRLEAILYAIKQGLS
jgi:DNA-binding NarL/FixJ family response regulator